MLNREQTGSKEFGADSYTDLNDIEPKQCQIFWHWTETKSARLKVNRNWPGLDKFEFKNQADSNEMERKSNQLEWDWTWIEPSRKVLNWGWTDSADTEL